MFTLKDFVEESNRIEGIVRQALPQEVLAHMKFLKQPPTVRTLTQFILAIQPDAALRYRRGMDVWVGSYKPPPGGPEILAGLKDLLRMGVNPYQRHVAYENLHPFTDGNGRSGRALWLYDMGGIDNVPLGFLHTFYYQTLQNSSRP